MAEASVVRNNGITPRTAQERAQAPRKEISQASLTRAVNKATNQTNWNDHNGARITLAKAFKYDDLVKRYENVAKAHEKAGQMTEELLKKRRMADMTLDYRIRSEFGEDIYRKVHRAL